MKMIKCLFFLVLAIEISGCSSLGKSWKEFVNGKKSDTPESPSYASATPAKQTRGLRFSQTKDVPVDDEGRRYKRMTKELFEEQARLEDRAGSLWVPDGQSSYLFSQNMVRLIGDNLNVKLEGDVRKTLEAKVDVIKKLMKKAKKDEQRRAVAGQASGENPEGTKEPKKEGDGKESPKDKKLAANNKKDEEEDKEEESTFGVNNVPSRILERLPDGNYRVRGVQSFMIGKNEYRVIAVGVVKPSDIQDDQVDASKMADSKFDIVSVKKDLKL